MPHIVIEHSSQPYFEAQTKELLEALLKVCERSDIIVPANVKMRIHPCKNSRVAGGLDAFLHVTVSLMEGPTIDEKSDLADLIFDALCITFPQTGHLTVDVRDMVPATYRKRSPDWKPKT